MQFMKKSQQHVEHRHRIGQTCFNVGGDPMENLLGMTHYRLHRESSFNDHALIPGAFFAQLEIRRYAIFAAKAQISQGNGHAIQTLNLIVEILVMGIHRQPFPAHNTPQVIEYPAQFDPNRPASFILVLFAYLFVTPSFADRKKQFNGKAIAGRAKRRFGQKSITQRLMIA